MRALTPSFHAAEVAGALLCAVALFAAGCGGSGGSSGTSQSQQTASTGSSSGGSSGNPFTPNGTGLDGETAFSQTVYPIVTQYCASCHAGAGPGFPHIAHPDLGTAYRAVIDNQKVNFANPNASRLVQRLVTDGHYCWSDCAMDGAQMEAAIVDWTTLIGYDPNGGSGSGNTGTAGQIQNGIISSYSNTFANAVLAASQRYEDGVIALWTFKEEQGTVARDLSPIAPGMDLELEGTAAWLPGGGIETSDGRAIADPTDSRKLYDRIASGSGTQQYSIEAWVVPANTDQEGPARIITYSSGTGNRNFMLGQRMYNYVFRNRSMAPGINQNGNPALETADADEDLQATLQHVVATFDGQNGRQLYVNGVFTDDIDGFGGDALINWNPSYNFVLGNETSNNRPWAGQFKLVAIFERALTPAQIMQNYSAGASEKYLLRFGLDDWIDPGSYVEFEVSDFDAYSYVFCFPTIVTGNPSGFSVEGLRVAVNGAPPVASQSFRNVSATVSQGQQQLSGLCSVVPKDLGINLDAFAIWFDVLGSYDVRVPEPPPTVPVDNSVLPPLPDIGIRDFARINDTMAELTGVDPNNAAVDAAYQELAQQLPMNSDIRSFVAAHQVGVSKLALEYCNEMVSSPALRQAFFGSQFQFNQPTTIALAGQAERDLIITPLADRMVGIGLSNQPDLNEIAGVINSLMDDLTMGCTPTTCDATRTQTVVTSSCAAVLGSLAVQSE